MRARFTVFTHDGFETVELAGSELVTELPSGAPVAAVLVHSYAKLSDGRVAIRAPGDHDRTERVRAKLGSGWLPPARRERVTVKSSGEALAPSTLPELAKGRVRIARAGDHWTITESFASSAERRQFLALCESALDGGAPLADVVAALTHYGFSVDHNRA